MSVPGGDVIRCNERFRVSRRKIAHAEFIGLLETNAILDPSGDQLIPSQEESVNLRSGPPNAGTTYNPRRGPSQRSYRHARHRETTRCNMPTRVLGQSQRIISANKLDIDIGSEVPSAVPLRICHLPAVRRE